MSDIVYARDPGLSVDDYITVVGDSILGKSRPLNDRARVGDMLAGSSLIVSARIDGECVGLARCLTDFVWVCYLGDLAVRNTHQRRGVGTGLLAACREILGEKVGTALLSVPEAVAYYNRVGPSVDLNPIPNAYFMTRRHGA